MGSGVEGEGRRGMEEERERDVQCRSDDAKVIRIGGRRKKGIGKGVRDAWRGRGKMRIMTLTFV